LLVAMAVRLSFRTYRRALRAPLRTAHGVWAERTGVLLRAEHPDGRVGWGEAAPIPWFGTETVEEAAETLGRLGESPDTDALAAVPARCGCVRFALAQALEPEPAPAAHPARLPVAALLPAGRAALEVLPERLEAGFLCCKWKVGVGRPEDEWAILDDLLSRLPAYVRLRLDANGAWDRRIAERWLARCAERPIEFVEQPAAPAETDLLLGLAADYPVTLALDESVASLASAKAWQDRGWRGIFVLKPALAGSLADLLAWAGATRPDLVFSSAIESAPTRARLVRTVLASGLSTRALGFGIGPVFGAAAWDGPPIGPLLDASWGRDLDPEAVWNAAN
jgi:O-succinylbenzoate synthase